MDPSIWPALASGLIVVVTTGAIMGLLTGAGQWFGLRCLTPRPAGWIVASGAGWTLGAGVVGALGAVLGDLLVNPMILVLAAMLGAAAVGLGQWWFLRRRVRSAQWWVPLTAICWGLGFAADRFQSMNRGGWPFDSLPLVIVVAGVLMGVALQLLLPGPGHNQSPP